MRCYRHYITLPLIAINLKSIVELILVCYYKQKIYFLNKNSISPKKIILFKIDICI